MAKSDFNPGNDRFIRNLVRHKANQMVGRAGFTPQDREVLTQEFFLRILQCLPQYDQDRGHRNSFVTAILDRHASNLLRDKLAEKRGFRRVVSLNVLIPVKGEGLIELVQTISSRELDARLGRRRMPDDERIQLAIDLEEVIATLPQHWRTLLELRKFHTMQKVADEMGVPRTTLNGWMRRIRQRVERAGLRDYLN